MPITISIRADIKPLQRSLNDLATKQLPFATATALTSLAQRVRAAEQKGMAATFDRPTPFTLNSIGVKPATKATLTATVFVKDIAAAYLLPFLDGGLHALGSKRGLLVPIEQAVNQYGNIPRNTLARLKGRKDVFVGSVTYKSGETITGVWQRPSVARRAKKGRIVQNGLKLLIRFSDPKPVTQRLDWRGRAERTVKTWFDAEFTAAMRKALATARR